MRKKGLLSLLAVTLVVVAAAGWAVRGRGPTSAAPDTGNKLFAELTERVNDVTQVHVMDADGSLTIEKREDQWVLVERGGYPVALDKVKQAVVGISELAIEEPKTSLPGNFAKLGVEEPGTPDSASKKVTLRDAEGSVLAAAILGETKFRRGSQAVYARRDGENQVYLCEGGLQVDTKPTSWIERDIIRLEGDRVSSVQVVHPDGEEVLIGRDPSDDSQFLLENTPPEREEKFAGVANGVGTALSYLGLEDVKPADEVDFAAEPLARTTYRCKDGLVVRLETARHEEATWVRLEADYEEPAEPMGPPAPIAISDTGEVTDPAAAEGPETAPDEVEPEFDPGAVQAEVADFNALWGPWAYSVQEYKAEVLARRMEDLLAEIVAEPPVEEPVPLEDGALDLDEVLQGGEEEAPAEVPPVPEDG